MATTRIEDAIVWTGIRDPASGAVAVSSAIAFDEDGVLALGEQSRALVVDTVVSASGAFVCPAFRDGHVHPIHGGLEATMAPVRDHESPDAIARAVGAWAMAHPDVEWVRGEGFDHSLAHDGIFLADWLDAHVPDRPVVLRATDYHTVWVNSEALRRVGYDAGTPQPRDGDIVRDADGRPVGTLRESGAWGPVYAMLPPVSTEEGRSALGRASAGFAAAGITWVQDAWVEPHDVEAWLAAAPDLAIRADLAMLCSPARWREQVDVFVATRARIEREAGGLLTATTVKFFADGVIESGTGAMLEPYCDHVHSRGLPTWDPDELAEAVAAVDAQSLNPHIHAIGDAAVRVALDAIAHAVAVNGRRDRRPVIAHAQVIDPADLGRFAELGVIVNIEPFWAQYDATQVVLTAPRLGPERTARQYPVSTLLAHGSVVSFGSDWPVTTYAPLECIQVAVTRRAPGDPSAAVLSPAECVTVEQALAAYTSGVAHQAGDARAGVLGPGARSDLVLLAADPRSVAPMDIGAIEVLGTWRAGIRTHGA